MIVPPTVVVPVAGVDAIVQDLSVAAPTVRVVVPLIVPEVAVMTVVPAATAVARPVASIVAVAIVPDCHETDDVMFCVVMSEYVPVAVNACVAPAAMVGSDGVTAMLTRDAEVTTIVAVPESPPEVAVMTELPAATAVARPEAGSIVATVVVAEVHAAFVIGAVVMSE